jgi:uncharacterized protein
MTTENLYTPDCIRTSSGIYVNVFEPKPEMFEIEDIAHALSHQCRFGGHLPTFYTVAQHCVYVSQLLGAPYALQGLMHDASEAYLLDIPSPIKARLSNYKEIEDKLMKSISKKFNFKWPLHSFVKFVDNAMLNNEWNQIMLGKDVKTIPEIWDPSRAKHEFIKQYQYLTT